jgi:hypothetical protein
MSPTVHSSRDLRRRLFGTMPDKESVRQEPSRHSETVYRTSRKGKGGKIYSFPVHREPEGK